MLFYPRHRPLEIILFITPAREERAVQSTVGRFVAALQHLGYLNRLSGPFSITLEQERRAGRVRAKSELAEVTDRSRLANCFSAKCDRF
jgi:hypothetical protein